MRARNLVLVSSVIAVFLAPLFLQAEEQPAFTHQEDVIYGRKYGTALTMDVITPTENKNGAGLVWVISGGWFSAHRFIQPKGADEYLKRGYTVFAVVHGSQPKFTIPEVISDMHRSIRFIRHHAAEYEIDPDRIGILGGSAGGHLSLMMGTAGNSGKPDSDDPVEQSSSCVQAVACFFPPTDFLNYGKAGEVALGTGILVNFKAPFDFHELDQKSRAFVPITDEKRRLEIGREISPIYHVTKDDPPTLIIHGDADKLVPIQQAETFVEKMQELELPAKLVVKEGAGHGWRDLQQDRAILADWFDKYLRTGKESVDEE